MFNLYLKNQEETRKETEKSRRFLKIEAKKICRRIVREIWERATEQVDMEQEESMEVGGNMKKKLPLKSEDVTTSGGDLVPSTGTHGDGPASEAAQATPSQGTIGNESFITQKVYMLQKRKLSGKLKYKNKFKERKKDLVEEEQKVRKKLTASGGW